MDECRHAHDHNCGNPDSPPGLPDRVIDVDGNGDTSKVKLHISSGEAEGYVALSYCWGGPQPMRALKSNLESLREGIDIQLLPQTIQDAIEVTRRLNQRYLWIDALCIVQDDTEDKAKNIATMLNIYKNATVTVAASASDAASKGFLRISRPLPPSCPVQLRIDGRTTTQIFITKRLRLSLQHPLDSRGWALQEFLLSPRILNFSTFELIWHCMIHDFKVMSMGSIVYEHDLQGRDSIVSPNPFIRRTRIAEKEFLLKSWRGIVEQYSRRRLTDPDDRLPVLAGIATELGFQFVDKYYFGLWLVELLPWYSLSIQCQRSSRAPTWSWASLDTEVSFSELSQTEATVEVAHSSSNEGRVLRLQGKFAKKSQAENLTESYDYTGSLDDNWAPFKIHRSSKFILLGYNSYPESSREGVGLIIRKSRENTYEKIGMFRCR